MSDLGWRGIYFVDLAPVSDSAQVIPTIASTLGLREERGRSPLECLKEEIDQNRVLLLLDNFEQVAGAAPVVAELLSACPHLKVLVTSRAALHIRGEYELRVDPLEQEAAVHALSATRPDLLPSSSNMTIPSQPQGWH